MQTVDQIIIPRWLLPMDDAHSTLTGHALAVAGERIVAVDTVAAVTTAYRADDTLTLADHALLPGLVNAHTHTAMTMLRGYADDLPLNDWLTKHIWPVEAACADAKFVEVGADLALAEMIKGGTTCFNEMYWFPEVVAARAERAGVRACIGMIVIDQPSAWANGADECIEKGLKLRDEVRHSSLVTTAFAPHAPYTVDDAALKKIQVLADELDCRVHIHLHESKREVEASQARYGMRPLERLEQLGLVGPRLSAVHLTQLLPGEIDTLAERGVSAVHCPQSNLKLGSGLCPVAALINAGVGVAIGTDGAASNNDLDMFAEMQTAALLAKRDEPTALPAYAALAAATVGGARALGLDHDTGALAAGKLADFIAVNLADCATQPVYQPASSLVYAAARHQVSDVWVGGKRLLDDGNLTTLDEAEVVVNAAALARKIGDRG